MRLSFKKAWKRMTVNQKLMALGDATGGFALAVLYFSYWGPLESVSLGWVLLVISILLQVPQWAYLSR